MKRELYIGDKKIVIEAPENTIIDIIENNDTIRISVTMDSGSVETKSQSIQIAYVDALYDKEPEDMPDFVKKDLDVVSELILKNNFNTKHSVDEFVEKFYNELLRHGLEIPEDEFKALMYGYLAYYGISRDFVVYHELQYVMREFSRILNNYIKEVKNAKNERYKCVLHSKINVLSKIIDILSGIVNAPSIVILNNDNIEGAFDYVIARSDDELKKKVSRVTGKQVKFVEHVNNSLDSLNKL